MLTLTAMAAAVTGYLAKSLKENQSIAAFLSDFTDTTVEWIRPIFLKDDQTPKKILNDLIANPDDKTVQQKVQSIIENNAEDDDKAIDILKEMVAKISEKTGNITTTNTNTSTVTGNNNVVIQGSLNSNINIDNNTQTHSGSGDNIKGDKIVNNTYIGNKPIDPTNGGVWKTMLSQSKIKEAIEYLLTQYKEDEEKHNTLLLLLGQYSFSQQNYNRGITTIETMNANRAKITNSLLEVFG